MRDNRALIVVGLGILALFFARGAAAQEVAPGSWIDNTVIPPDLAPIPPDAQDNPQAVPIDAKPPEAISGEQAMTTDEQLLSDAAFLYMIRCCEHRYPRDVLPVGPDAPCYTTFFGGARFSDLSNHPVITGEMKPVRLSDAMCKAAGFGPGCVSTAAGGYQFIRPTWERLRNKGEYLEDFSPANQSEAALRLLEEIGARNMYIEGDLEGAIRTAGKAWASLPGSRAQQNPKAMQYCIDRFNEGVRLYSAAARDDLPPLP